MHIQHTNSKSDGSFFIEVGSERLAEMTYSWAGDHTFIINHTEVSEALEGKGIGRDLVLEAVEYARQHQYKIIPQCTFAKSVFNKTPAYSDVLA